MNETDIYNNIPLFMVITFLLLTLGVGLCMNHNATTLRAYTIGNKQFATATLVATTLATTWGGAQVVRDVENIHHFGLYWILFAFLNFADILVIIPLSLRMTPFMQHLSLPETIGSIYGKYPRMITAASGIAGAIAIIASQIRVMASALHFCLTSANPHTVTYVTLLATLILILYATLGGIRSVTFTDVLQFITFAIVLPLLNIYLFYRINKPTNEMIAILKVQEKFHLNSLFSMDTSTKPIALIATILAILMAIDPTTMQRVYMASGTTQANKVFWYTGLASFIMTGCIVLIGLFVCMAAPTIPKEAVWPYIIAQIPPILQGLVCICLLAMTMSTADSKLHTCTAMVSHDIVASLQTIRMPYTHTCWLIRSIARLTGLWINSISRTNPLKLVKLVSVTIGLLAMSLALTQSDLFALLKLALDLYVPIATAPFILALYGFRSSSHTALSGMGMGTLAILAWNRWIEPTTAIPGAFPCMAINGLTMLTIHYYKTKQKSMH